METLKKNLANLLKVKTIVTILLTVVFCVLALTGEISSVDFLTVFAVVIAFYFGTQAQKNAKAVSGTTYNENVVQPGTEEVFEEPTEEMNPIGFAR